MCQHFFVVTKNEAFQQVTVSSVNIPATIKLSAPLRAEPVLKLAVNLKVDTQLNMRKVKLPFFL